MVFWKFFLLTRSLWTIWAKLLASEEDHLSLEEDAGVDVAAAGDRLCFAGCNLKKVSPVRPGLRKCVTAYSIVGACFKANPSSRSFSREAKRPSSARMWSGSLKLP